MDHNSQAADDQITGAISENEQLSIEVEALSDMLIWAYSKLHERHFSDLADAIELDRIKLYVEHGVFG